MKNKAVARKIRAILIKQPKLGIIRPGSCITIQAANTSRVQTFIYNDSTVPLYLSVSNGTLELHT